ncbi:MAG: tetratricopeptide repeat protein [Candidatus Omnitrophica bacterium]|nr:tetratricopeptide repeat protein [Candidatus Omnitrophota bacterium]
MALSFPIKVYSAQDAEKELFFVAQSAFDDGFYDVAIRYIEEFMQKYPQSDKKGQVLLLSGQCYFFKNQYLKAFNTFQDLLKYSEYKDATLFWLGETYLKGLDYAQAEKSYKQVVELYPNSSYAPQAYYSLGWSYFDQKKYTDSSETFSKLLKQYPTHQLAEDATYKVAECAYNLGDYFRSVELFKGYLLKFPQTSKEVQVDFYIAESYYYQEKYVESNIYYRKVQETSQDTGLIVASYVSQGWGFLKLKNYPASIEAFTTAESIASEKHALTDDVYLGKASYYSETGDAEQALQAYQKLLELFPKSARMLEAHLGIANVFYSQQKYNDAIREYKVVIDSGDQAGESQDIIEKANFGMAWTYLKMGQVDQSIASFQTVLDKTKSTTVKVSALTQIGDAYQDMSEWNKAVEVYDRILKEYPGSVYSDYVQYRQGIALLKLSKIELATIAFQSLQQNFPKSKYLADINYYLGVAYFKKGDWSAAIKAIETFLKNPSHPADFTPEANYVLALCMLNLSKAEDAIKLFQKIIKNYPNNLSIVRNSEMGMAKAYHSLGQDKEAVRRFKLILYKYPDTETEEDALFWLAQFYFKSGDYPGAIEYYQKILGHLKNKDKSGRLHYELGQAYEMNKEYEKALIEYRKIPESDKEMAAKGGLSIAGIFSKELDPDKAAITYQKIIDTNPEFRRDAYMKLAQVYRRGSEFEKEAKTYEDALSTSKGVSVVSDVQLQFSIGDAYEAMSAWEKAIEGYLKIPYLYKSEPGWAVKAYLRVARIFENNEDWDNAKATYEKVLTYQTEESTYAQERIDWIKNLKVKKK